MEKQMKAAGVRAIPVVLGAGLLAAMLVTLSLPHVVQAAAGDLDTSFGTGGKVITDFGGSDLAQTLAVQADGKVVVAGRSNATGSFDFALARYNPDGSMDTSFGTGGKVLTDFGSGSLDGAFALALQPDGKLVAAGFSGTDFALARYQGGERKRGGSQSRHLLDPAMREVFTHIKTLAEQGHPFDTVVQAEFSLHTFHRLPIGTGLLEPTALTGGHATLQLTSTNDPNIVSVRLLSLSLEGPHFSFEPDIQAITGTLDLRTGAFQVSLSFRRLMTPETRQPFTWQGTAYGVYGFATGLVSLTEVGQGAFLGE